MVDERYRGHRTERYMYYVARERYMVAGGCKRGVGPSRAESRERSSKHPRAFSPRDSAPAKKFTSSRELVTGIRLSRVEADRRFLVTRSK